MNRAWIAVASAEHVRQGRALGFMQVCHGKVAPLRRIHPGDRIAYYSPTITFRGKDTLQAFTALGVVRSREPYEFDMGRGFCPFRRDVDWAEARETPIQPLLDRMEFSAGVRNWGYQLRFGLFAVSEHDMDVISGAMLRPGARALDLPAGRPAAASVAAASASAVAIRAGRHARVHPVNAAS